MHHEVHLACPIFSYDELEQVENCKIYTKSITTTYIDPYIAKARCLFNLFSKKPFTIRYFFSKKFKEAIQHQDFDVVLVDCSSMAQYVLDIEKPKIVDFVDIDSDKWKLYSRRSWPPKSIIYRIEYRRLQLLEKDINKQFNFCLVVSEDEKKLLQDDAKVVIIPNGIDLEFFVPRAQQNDNTLIFTGAMNYFPNIDGVSYFHRDIWPLVKEHIQDVRFIVAGMSPPPKIRALASEDTTITGFISDVRDYLSQATVCVVPLRIAKGIQNKILEAMAMGIPVVATTAANAGIKARDKHQILVANSPEDFARSVLMLLKDSQLRQTIADNARQFVQENFSWSKNLSKLDELIAQLTAK
jgi:sugar transferase (PEP-CTERM/EpsH1 system associated)